MSTLRQSLKYSFASSGNARKWRKITPKRRNNTRRFVGRVIADRYKIEEIIGSGGWSVIHAGTDLISNTRVAIKFMHPWLSSDPAKVQRFNRECAIGSELSHKNICKVRHYGMLDQCRPYMVMDFYEGKTLSEIIRSDGPLSEREALGLFIEIADAVEEAHKYGVVHRDITPSNIFVTRDQEGNKIAKLLDFGLAKGLDGCEVRLTDNTGTGETVGTPTYMSPEQCLGSNIDERTDIFSLGCVIYYALAGQPPFSGGSLFECMIKRFHVAARNFSEVSPGRHISSELEAVVRNAIEPNLQSRIQSAAILKQALLACADSGSDRQMPASSLSRLLHFPLSALVPPSSIRKVNLLFVALLAIMLGFSSPSLCSHANLSKKPIPGLSDQSLGKKGRYRPVFGLGPALGRSSRKLIACSRAASTSWTLLR